jgi:hypothetical protein
MFIVFVLRDIILAELTCNCTQIIQESGVRHITIVWLKFKLHTWLAFKTANREANAAGLGVVSTRFSVHPNLPAATNLPHAGR